MIALFPGLTVDLYPSRATLLRGASRNALTDECPSRTVLVVHPAQALVFVPRPRAASHCRIEMSSPPSHTLLIRATTHFTRERCPSRPVALFQCLQLSRQIKSLSSSVKSFETTRDRAGPLDDISPATRPKLCSAHTTHVTNIICSRYRPHSHLFILLLAPPLPSDPWVDLVSPPLCALLSTPSAHRARDLAPSVPMRAL